MKCKTRYRVTHSSVLMAKMVWEQTSLYVINVPLKTADKDTLVPHTSLVLPFALMLFHSVSFSLFSLSASLYPSAVSPHLSIIRDTGHINQVHSPPLLPPCPLVLLISFSAPLSPPHQIDFISLILFLSSDTQLLSSLLFSTSPSLHVMRFVIAADLLFLYCLKHCHKKNKSMKLQKILIIKLLIYNIMCCELQFRGDYTIILLLGFGGVKKWLKMDSFSSTFHRPLLCQLTVRLPHPCGSQCLG